MRYLYNQIILFGDSITQFSHNSLHKGWGAAIQDAYIRKLDVLNRGFAGYNTEKAKHLLPQILPKKDRIKHLLPQLLQKKNGLIKGPKIFLLTIFFGANDAATPPSIQHVPLEKYKENLRQMINIIKHPDSPYYSPETRILLITPPPLDEEAWKKFIEEQGGTSDRKYEITAKYAQTCLDLANELKIPVLDSWKLFTDKVESDNVPLTDFLVDGLHLSALGNETLFHGIMDKIRKDMPELNPDNLKQITPLWNEQPSGSLESKIASQFSDFK